MNERIRELALQAGVTGYFAAGTEYATPIPLSDEVQKFAELIVGECSGIVQNYMSRWPEDHELTKQIKEHFGVEE
jgi:hypothetical protein